MNWIRNGFALASLGISGIAIVGWVTGEHLLASTSTEYIPMAPSTAICFVVLSMCIIFVRRKGATFFNVLGLLASSLVVAYCLLLLVIGYGVGGDVLERWLVSQPERFGEVVTGRMSIVTALCFLALGGSVSLNHFAAIHDRSDRTLAASLALGSLVIASLVLIGYAFGQPLLYGGSHIPVAVTTALSFVTLSVGAIYAAGPESWPLRHFLGPAPRAVLLRSFLPIGVGAIIMYSVICFALLREDGANTVLAAAATSALTGGVIVVTTAHIAGRIGKALEMAESLRLDAQEELLSLNAELERRVADRTSELESANANLESFSYSVSHDLRSPLRSISLHAGVLREELGASAEGEIAESLEGIESSILRMDALITDLLSFSKVSRIRLERTTVDLADVARQLSALVTARHNPRARVSIPDSMPAQGDAHLIHILLENLLSNALKYSSQVEDPRVELGSFVEAGETVFYIRDNGIGFDPTLFDKALKPFERLHSSREYAGTGIGLSICERIIGGHGGTLWAESEEGRGATLFFTLEGRPADEDS
ncbi:MAG: hypothetical protein EDM74_00260 [Armatimonadetes bacterium]|nr:MAG: hypothetical protein EDM74_00260 [Armatimonadota bacterium]